MQLLPCVLLSLASLVLTATGRESLQKWNIKKAEGRSGYFVWVNDYYLYLEENTRMSQIEAMAFCGQFNNMQLISFETPDKRWDIMTFLKDHVVFYDATYWTSGMRSENGWIWATTGESVVDQFWAEDQPDLNIADACMAIDGYYSWYIDEPCKNTQSFNILCEEIIPTTIDPHHS